MVKIKNKQKQSERTKTEGEVRGVLRIVFPDLFCYYLDTERVSPMYK